MPTLGSGQDGYVVSFDYVSDKFVVRPDNSGLPEAPIDGLSYVRKDEAWEADPIQTDAPNDGLRYIWRNEAWEEDKNTLDTLIDTNIVTPTNG